ncbi:linear amide C-N hydrolase [Commensalibacter papalotli (ex Botero et al. 2024)]|uniref:Ntn superfamily (YxeI) (PDB:2BJF) n=1 Tax=Commensalibacter papalotli (ex Botero et al. 2024) TaxID=2972766 RepID=A0ABM9HRW3_9PROT|nr:linear amide C-N hydrolase [Commensalibacter papalotli (ex Botero et al. 2024)]CAI3940643.1 Ntn superfamily (YxeI) (PDB:2BJF) [Commensalibacter papalotli (ex Botero et al. 2024)]CAI3950374.1 Ntn superfamily (YxeI) (PDB:2BJF) [Commensalibacter papalotli (ex Botero et al. 2024)]
MSFACTSLIIKDADQRIYHGRTLEFMVDYPSYLTYYPKGSVFNNIDPDGLQGLQYTAKYNILCITMPAFSSEDRSVIEGMNNAGLSFSANMYALSQTPPLKQEEYKQALPLVKIGSWGLALFQSVNEVKQALLNQPVWSPALPLFENSQCPFHFIFYDKTGKSIVVEYTKGELHIYDNPTGVLTNAPEFSWHLTNMHNYTMLTNKDSIASTELGSLSLQEPDIGNATAGLPADDTSVGRFVRGVFYTSYALKAQSSDMAIIELSHIMNKFDRPKNMTVGLNGKTEYTEWTSLSDLERGHLYVRTYRELNYTKYSLSDYESENIFYSKQLI